MADAPRPLVRGKALRRVPSARALPLVVLPPPPERRLRGRGGFGGVRQPLFARPPRALTVESSQARYTGTPACAAAVSATTSCKRRLATGSLAPERDVSPPPKGRGHSRGGQLSGCQASIQYAASAVPFAATARLLLPVVTSDRSASNLSHVRKKTSPGTESRLAGRSPFPARFPPCPQPHSFWVSPATMRPYLRHSPCERSSGAPTAMGP